jgi:toxin ParE1/3/4
MRVVWSPLALSDLRHVEAYIREHDPRAARETARKIKQATRRLADFPASGRPGRWPNTRELVVPGTPYILPYCVRDQELWIIAVLHATRKWPESE